MEALKGHVTQAEAGGHLAQESCRALRHLCFQNELGLEKMHRLGACTIVLGKKLFGALLSFYYALEI
jgi:hypothetical protein